jgi:hypothetical protein
MQIKHSVGVAIFAALGNAAAEKWVPTKLAKRLATIEDTLAGEEPEIEDAKVKKALDKVRAAVKAEDTIEVVDDRGGAEEAEEAPAEKPAKKAAAAPAKKAAKAADPDEDEDEDDSVPVKKAAEKKGVKTAKKAAAPKPAKEKSTTPGVRASRSRPYLAGIIIKKHTLEAGVTDEMCEELNTAYGKENTAESMFTLRNAWHAIRGWNKKGNEAELEQAATADE